MLSGATSGVIRVTLTVLLGVGGFMTLFFMYYKSSPSVNCSPMPAHYAQHTIPSTKSDKPIMLLWFWPENYKFDLGDCKTFFNIDGCLLTDDRSLFNKSDAVLIFQNAIKKDLSNLPTSPRPQFQRWIWFQPESPTNTTKIPGIENLFNLTLTYRQDADIPVHSQLTSRKVQDEDFVLPKKDKLVCWIVSNTDPKNNTEDRFNYYRELIKHIKVNVFGNAFDSLLKDEDYFSTISSCKFYLAFESSIHRDYITEKLNGPLAVGTVPIVLGPPRQNYEEFVPGDSFIHVKDYPDAKALAEFILRLDKDGEAYMRYFQWRKYLSAKPHLILQNQKFIQAICFGCKHLGRHNRYRVIKDIYKWFFG